MLFTDVVMPGPMRSTELATYVRAHHPGVVVLFTSGFAETGDDGAGQQAELTAIARRGGVRLLGPNCLGFMNVGEQLYATFSPAPASGPARAWGAAIRRRGLRARS